MAVSDWLEIVKANGVSMLLILILCFFLIFKFWPWYINVYFPAMQKRQDQAATTQSLLQQSIAQLSSSIASMPDKFAAQLMGNISQAVSPLFDQVNTQVAALQLNTMTQLQQLLVSPNVGIAAIGQQLNTLTADEKNHHQAVLDTITTLQNHLTVLIAAQPKAVLPPPSPPNTSTPALPDPANGGSLGAKS
jgi:hypothetical protein